MYACGSEGVKVYKSPITKTCKPSTAINQYHDRSEFAVKVKPTARLCYVNQSYSAEGSGTKLAGA